MDRWIDETKLREIIDKIAEYYQEKSAIAVVDDHGEIIAEGAHGIIEKFPKPSAVVAHVLANVRFDTRGAGDPQPPAGNGLSAGEIMALFSRDEHKALISFIRQPHEDAGLNDMATNAMLLWMELPTRQEPLRLDDENFVEFVGALVTGGILSSQRADEVLAGIIPG